MAESEQTIQDDFRELCYHMGLALIIWQRVEELHFHIFGRFLGVPLGQVTSAAYHSTESFDARNTMLDRMAQYFLNPIRELLPRETAKQYKELRIRWQELKKLLKDTNLNRNKLAHYTADFDLINMRTVEGGDIVFDVTSPTLRPGPLNFVSRLFGRTKDKKEHNLGVPELKRYVVEFRQVEEATAAFLLELGKLPEPHAPIGGQNQGAPDESPPSPEIPHPTDEPPSDQ
ncbi:MAG: hypothetical protein WB764_30085 [Xanthobacteraceae bacterium]